MNKLLVKQFSVVSSSEGTQKLHFHSLVEPCGCWRLQYFLNFTLTPLRSLSFSLLCIKKPSLRATRIFLEIEFCLLYKRKHKFLQKFLRLFRMCPQLCFPFIPDDCAIAKAMKMISKQILKSLLSRNFSLDSVTPRLQLFFNTFGEEFSRKVFFIKF